MKILESLKNLQLKISIIQARFKMKPINSIIINLAVILASIPLNGQIAPDTYWVQFTDKAGTPYVLNSPEMFLSKRAIERREHQDISIDTSDLPVSPVYVDSMRNLGLEVRNVSKWLNGIIVRSTDNQLLDTLHHISFIAKPVKKTTVEEATLVEINKFPLPLKSTIDYGYSKKQINMLHGESLHENGYNGEGILIGILDAGFTSTDKVESLQHLWQDNKIVTWRDFVNDGKGFFQSHSHGTTVLSILAGVIPGVMYGAAPNADYALIRTENGDSEYLVEEYNWVCGAEYADSIGVDVINSSLGYSLFNDPSQNHSYKDLDGRTTPASRGALMAARKGILVSCSAGNSGNDANWGHITAPSDADSILTVGAVDSLRVIAYFSGRGPTFDNRTKPDVCAMGVNTISQSTFTMINGCNGTSCSSPIIAGMSACLWQANPTATAQQIRNAIQVSSSIYHKPDTIYGFGIPDFHLANLILHQQILSPDDLTNICIVPNPSYENSYIIVDLPWLNKKKEGTISILDLNGRIIFQYEQNFNPGNNINTLLLPENIEKGHYFAKIEIDGRYYDAPFIKL
jgi:serine protease AprX